MPSPTIVAIDTAGDDCSVALAHEGRIASLVEPSGQLHLERVLRMVDALLAAGGIALQQCDAIAFGCGPGSFTGLRIACGVAQGLAYGIERPVIAVQNLRALAYAAGGAAAGARLLAAVDARMQQVYWALFDSERDHAGDAWRQATEPALAHAADLTQLVEHWQPSVIAGNALSAYEASWPASVRACARPGVKAGAAQMAALALEDFRAGRAFAAQLAAPLYVRDRVALTLDERRQQRLERAAADGTPIAGAG